MPCKIGRVVIGLKHLECDAGLICIKDCFAPDARVVLNRQEAQLTSISNRKAGLEARLAELGARLHIIESELDSHNAQDWQELATEREGDEVLEGMGLSAQQEIKMIEAVLVRIATGDYGTCMKCGADIGEERLNVLPYTPFCRDCAA